LCWLPSVSHAIQDWLAALEADPTRDGTTLATSIAHALCCLFAAVLCGQMAWAWLLWGPHGASLAVHAVTMIVAAAALAGSIRQALFTRGAPAQCEQRRALLHCFALLVAAAALLAVGTVNASLAILAGVFAVPALAWSRTAPFAVRLPLAIGLLPPVAVAAVRTVAVWLFGNAAGAAVVTAVVEVWATALNPLQDRTLVLLAAFAYWPLALAVLAQV